MTSGPPDPLTAAMIIDLGGWNRRFAVVVAVQVVGDVGMALVDSNDDGREVEQEHYRWIDGRWCAGSSSGPTSDRVGVSSLGEHAYGVDDSRYRYAIGRAANPGPEIYTLFGSEVRVQANERRWWIHIELPDPERPWAPLSPDRAHRDLKQSGL